MATVRSVASMAKGGTDWVVVVLGGRVVVGAGASALSGTVVIEDTAVVVGVGSTVVETDDGSTVVGVTVVGVTVVGVTVVGVTVVAGTVVAVTVVAGTVVAGTVVRFVDPPEVVEVGRIVVVGGGAGRASTSTRSPWGKTCRSTKVTAALAT